jgi:hypothetical protein
MATIYPEKHLKSQRAIKAVVRALDRGEQPPDDVDVRPAIDFEYAEYELIGEDQLEMFLTPKGCAAAVRWRKGRDTHGGDAA